MMRCSGQGQPLARGLRRKQPEGVGGIPRIRQANASANGIVVQDSSDDGIAVFHGATLTVSDSVIADNGSGVNAGEASSILLFGSEVSGNSGAGVSAQGGTIQVSGSEIVGNNENGVVAQIGGNVRVANTVVENVDSQA